MNTVVADTFLPLLRTFLTTLSSVAPSALLALHRLTGWVLASWHIHFLQSDELISPNNWGVIPVALAHIVGVSTLLACLLDGLNSWLILHLISRKDLR